MDPKHSHLCSRGCRGDRGPGVGAGDNDGTRPSFCLAGWILEASAAALFSGTRRGTRRVSGLVGIGAAPVLVLVLVLMLQSSLASDGKTACPTRVDRENAPSITL